MIVDGFPNLSVIQAMRGHVDFYKLHGQAIARRWPRLTIRAPTPAQLYGQQVPAMTSNLRSYMTEYWVNAWNQMRRPTGRTSWDTFTNVFYWLAHHHYVIQPPLPFAGQLEAPMMPVAVEVIPRPTTTLVYIYILWAPRTRIGRITIHLVAAPDDKPGQFAYVYTAAYSAAPGNRPPPYAWAWPQELPLLFSQFLAPLWRFELYYPGVFSQCNFWTTFRFIPGDTPQRTNPPTNPVWYSGHFPDFPVGPWTPGFGNWPWRQNWPPYYAAL